MTLWGLAGIIAGFGALGGIINALISDNGFILWKMDRVNGTRIWRPGFIGNVAIGAAAAFVSWGLYGRWAGSPAVGTPAGSTSQPSWYETLSALTGAFLVGVAGARVLTAEIDKKFLQLAAAQATAAASAPDQVATMATAAPAEVARAAADLPAA